MSTETESLAIYTDPESLRLADDEARKSNWKRWGPYLSERQWATVREDYSPYGNCWDYFPHDHARSRAYRWGEDGLLGFTDRECRLCFALALWNGRDPILKERIFGLTGPEGNHGEDAKDLYFYLDSTPTHSYMKSLYKYPHAEFPYAAVVEENRRRGKGDPEFEISDTGVFDGGRYFDVVAEYAKASENDILARVTIKNLGPEAQEIHVLPTLWFRNTWSWGCSHEGCTVKPRLSLRKDGSVLATHPTLGSFRLEAGAAPDGSRPEMLFTENETNVERLYGSPNPTPFVKDAFHRRVVNGDAAAVNAKGQGTKAAAWYRLRIPAGGSAVVKLRLAAEASAPKSPFGSEFDGTFAQRIADADRFYAARLSPHLTDLERAVSRQAFAGLLFSKQFYHYAVKEWFEGDPDQPKPPRERESGRNTEWKHLFSRDILSMPDKWEYPWFAAWDHAFHMIPMAVVDPDFAKKQLVLLLREWYMHPNGQIPAYEFAFGDVNPPVHAWAAWRVYKMSAPEGSRDTEFLERVFLKLVLNFTWWVNRKDAEGKNLFSGGFLGLDNIGVFDRSQPLPTGGHLEQADGTAWMAFYCATMLSMALELARTRPAYEDMASKFFEHFVAITDAMNSLGGNGLWDEGDGFYYDRIHFDGSEFPIRLRSMVGLIPLFTVEVLSQDVLDKLPGFSKRMNWFLENRKDLAAHISCMEKEDHKFRLLSIPSRERLVRVLKYLLDEREFLSPFGFRSLSRAYGENPFVFDAGGQRYTVDYVPGESNTGVFGGNSNWRGPIWFPVNYLLVEALERYHHYYKDTIRVECPTGSGRFMNLKEVANELWGRLSRIFLPGENGRRPFQGDDRVLAHDPHSRELVLFHEYFHGETGRGVGANHQTGWTALVVRCIHKAARARSSQARPSRKRGSAVAAARG